MNGRIYDPTLGRFLQADPHIQAPMNSQNYNRYSYVLNNPMSYTDPSGYFFKALGKFVKKYWRQIAAIAVTYFTAGAASGWAAAWGFSGAAAGAVTGAIAGAAGGFVATGSLRGALVGAVSGAAFGAIGASGWNEAGKFAATGAVGGVSSNLQGGNFGHGFWSAGLGSAAGGQYSTNAPTQVIMSAVVGGTISKLTGGKFANGAYTAAFAAALRADWKSSKTGSVTYGDVTTDDIKKTVGDAVKSGHALTKKALSSLDAVAAGDNDAVEKFKRFFGEVTDEKITQVRGVYSKIDSAFEAGLTVNFDLNSDAYAYVYSGGKVEVFLGKAFMRAGTSGFDSKGGVFLHEVGHEVGGLNDIVYGVSGAESLATQNQIGALRNADSYEYFAESL